MMMGWWWLWSGLRRLSGDVGDEVMGWRWVVAWGDDGDDVDNVKMMMTMRGGGDDGELWWRVTWGIVKIAYDKYVMWGITHWGPKRQRFYGYTSNRKSKHDVFSTKRIIAVTHVKVKKCYDYGYLEEIEVRREDQQLYKFREGDFPRLNLHDIEDILLLLVQKKL
ncbi:hypothetical protein Tco_1149225, partial [Tanacetum coccineum]